MGAGTNASLASQSPDADTYKIARKQIYYIHENSLRFTKRGTNGASDIMLFNLKSIGS
jgi:hypothetical protein